MTDKELEAKYEVFNYFRHWYLFRTNQVVIHPMTEELAQEFLQFCKDHGYPSTDIKVGTRVWNPDKCYRGGCGLLSEMETDMEGSKLNWDMRQTYEIKFGMKIVLFKGMS